MKIKTTLLSASLLIPLAFTMTASAAQDDQTRGLERVKGYIYLTNSTGEDIYLNAEQCTAQGQLLSHDKCDIKYAPGAVLHDKEEILLFEATGKNGWHRAGTKYTTIGHLDLEIGLSKDKIKLGYQLDDKNDGYLTVKDNTRKHKRLELVGHDEHGVSVNTTNCEYSTNSWGLNINYECHVSLVAS